MKLDKLFINSTIVSSTGRFRGCVGVKDGLVAVISETSDGYEAGETIDLGGKFILPGLIDGHIHFQDPGLTHREDFEHATAAAASGGITMCLSHPMNVPAIVDVDTYNANVAAYKGRAYIDYGVHGGAVETNLDKVDELWKTTGATTIKMFMCFSVVDFPFVQDDAMYSHLEILAKNDGIALIHCENDLIIKRMEKILQAEGKNDGMAYNASHPDYAEVEAIQRAIFFLEKTGARAIIVHVSTAEGLRLIKKAQDRGVKVFAETCPHFLTFVSDDMKVHGPFLKFSPPMHEESNRQDLWELLAKGYVQTIGSDHCPFTTEEKEKGRDNIWNAPNGIPGLETLAPVLLNGVNDGLITLEKMVEVTSYNPSHLYGLYPKKGVIQVGSDADFTVVDMDLKKKYTAADLKSKCPWSPYFGREFKGWPVVTVVRGEMVYKDGEIVGKFGHGKYVARPKDLPLTSV